MGRKTYDVARKLGKEGHSGKKNYVFSWTPRPATTKLEFRNEEIDKFATRHHSCYPCIDWGRHPPDSQRPPLEPAVSVVRRWSSPSSLLSHAEDRLEGNYVESC